MLAALDADEQAALFAHCASCGVNALWEAVTRYNQGSVSERTVTGRLAHSHILARANGLDLVAEGWTPAVDNYFGRVNQPHIHGAVEEARVVEATTPSEAHKRPPI